MYMYLKKCVLYSENIVLCEAGICTDVFRLVCCVIL